MWTIAFVIATSRKNIFSMLLTVIYRKTLFSITSWIEFLWVLSSSINFVTRRPISFQPPHSFQIKKLDIKKQSIQVGLIFSRPLSNRICPRFAKCGMCRQSLCHGTTNVHETQRPPCFINLYVNHGGRTGASRCRRCPVSWGALLWEQGAWHWQLRSISIDRLVTEADTDWCHCPIGSISTHGKRAPGKPNVRRQFITDNWHRCFPAQT